MVQHEPFLDTNIILSFYHLASDDLEELKKLIVLVKEGKVKLFLPQQVLDEFKRNRENKIADAIKRLKEQRINLQLPQIAKKYGENYERLRQAHKDYEKYHAILVSQIEKDAIENNLDADEVIDRLIEVAQIIPISHDLLILARTRMDLGNPPGKKGSLGDAVNWESLLTTVPDNEDLFFVAGDGDYFSALDFTQLDPFLQDEWEEKKWSDIHAYRRLSAFFQDHFPNIQLSTELEKDLLIKGLTQSNTFNETHTIVSKLSKYSDFSRSQVNDIVIAAITNNQVYWIAEDVDVQEFLYSIVHGREEQIDPENLTQVSKILKSKDTFEEIPF